MSNVGILWDSWVPGIGLADYTKVNDQTISKAVVERVDAQFEPCVRLYTRKGAEIDCARSSILTCTDGQIDANTALGKRVTVRINDTWETDDVISVVPIGMHRVVYITCNNSYLAGRSPDFLILFDGR
jgi:hypothetical protein